MTLRIDRRLYLTVPIYRSEEGSEVVAWVHSAPLSEETVDAYFMILGQTYSMIFSNGFGLTSGPAFAMRILRHTATERGVWDDDPKSGAVGVRRGLVEEMRRLTNVAVLKDGKWEQVPLDVAEQSGVVTADDRQEVENAIAFFIVASATLGRAQRGPMLAAAAELWGAQVTSSPFTEFTSSLKTSTVTGSSGEKSPAPAKDDSPPADAPPAKRPRSVPV